MAVWQIDKRNNNTYSHYNIFMWRLAVILLDLVERQEGKEGIMTHGKVVFNWCVGGTRPITAAITSSFK